MAGGDITINLFHFMYRILPDPSSFNGSGVMHTKHIYIYIYYIYYYDPYLSLDRSFVLLNSCLTHPQTSPTHIES